jgi:WD40 repeat protein
VERVPSIPDFVLLRRIGGGSYGEVWLGRSVTGVYRAVKVIERARFEDDRPFFRELEGITRFQQALGDQPRQLALLHVGRNDAAGLLYYVMELADDAETGALINPPTYVPLTLKELRHRRQTISAADCVRIGAELAAALGELHRAGLLHRDVKPSNVIFVNGHAKLADIGLIAVASDTVSMVGTPEYAAPEGTGSVRSDLFSLGKILYELSTGLHPAEFPRLPGDLRNRPDADAVMELNEVVLRACDPAMGKRYPDAEALLADLRLLQAGRSIQELNHVRRRLRLLSWFAGVTAAAALVVITLLGVRNYFAVRALAAQESAFRRAAEANERLARYTSDLHFAQLALTGGDIGAARTALRRQIPMGRSSDLRGLEWHALWHQSEGDAVRTCGEVGGPPVTAVALSADGRSAVIIERATPNRAVMLDLNTGARSLIAQDCYGLAAYDSARRRLVTTRGDCAVDVIDPITGQRHPQTLHGVLLELSPDDRHVLLARTAPEDGTLVVWDTEEARTILEWDATAGEPGYGLSRAALAGNATRLAVSLFSTADPSRPPRILVRAMSPASVAWHLPDPAPAGRLRFSADGRYLAISTPTDVRVIDVPAQQTACRLPVANAFEATDFSPDGSRLAVGGPDGALTIWSMPTGTRISTLRGHESAILAMHWGSDGQMVFTGGLDGTCRCWRLGTERTRHALAGLWAQDLGSVAINGAGSAIAVTGADGSVAIMNPTTLVPVMTLKPAFVPLAFTDADQALWSLSLDYHLVKTEFRNSTTERTRIQLQPGSPVVAFAVSTNGRHAAFGRQSGEVRVWSIRDAIDRGTRWRTPQPVRALAISGDGECVAVSDRDADLQVMMRDSVFNVPTDAALVTSLAFSPDDALLVAGTERGELMIWDRRAARVTARVNAHSAEIRSLIFTPDGTRLLSGGVDGLVLVWTTADWRWVAAWLIESTDASASHGVYRLAMNATGSWFAALTEGGELQRWDCRTETTAASAVTSTVPGYR